MACGLLERLKMSKVLALPVALLSIACGGDAERSDPDGGNQPDPDSGTPILERTSLATHECEIVDQPDEVAGDTIGSAVAVVGDSPLVARASFGPIGDDDYGGILAVTPASFAPVGLGDEAYRTTALEPLRFPSLAATDEGAAIAWVAGDQSQRIMGARLDGAGDIVGSPTEVAEADAAVLALAMAATGSTIHVLWFDSALRVRAVGSNGAPLGEATTVRAAPVTGAALATAGEGTVAVWTEPEADAGVYLALLDAAGTVTAGPLRVSGTLPEHTFVDLPAVVAAGDELMVAWREHLWEEDPDGDPGTWDPRGHAIIRVARVDRAGERVLASARLQTVEEEFVHTQPALVAQGGAVALSWSRGVFISACGGCISDNKRRLVLLEPRDLVPLGEVIEMVGVTGFSRATMIEVAGDLAHVLGLDYHAISNLALARTTCSAR